MQSEWLDYNFYSFLPREAPDAMEENELIKRGAQVGVALFINMGKNIENQVGTFYMCGSYLQPVLSALCVSLQPNSSQGPFSAFPAL